jgi:hypothetical protein
MTQYPLYRRLVRPQGWSGWVLKVSPPPGFDPWTVQLVSSCYGNYIIPAHSVIFNLTYNIFIIYEY